MAVALRSVGVSPGASSTSCVIVKPVGLSVGDLMIAHVTSSTSFGTPGAISAPDESWTEIRQDASLKLRGALFWKIADSDDTSATDFTFTPPNSSNIGAISAWTGHDAATPINANNGQYNANNITVTAPTITPSVASCMILMIVSCASARTTSGYAVATSNPVSWGEAYDIGTTLGADTAAALGYAIRVETTATGNGTATLSAAHISTGQLVAIAPAAVAAAGRSFGFIFG